MGSDIDKNSLIQVVKSNNLMEIFPILLNKKAEGLKITPSEFIKEITLTTEERYKKLAHMSMMNPQHSSENHLGISVTPQILMFQSFEVRKKYSLQVIVRNCRKVLLPLKMICPKSSYFTAEFTGPPITKVAPGLSADYQVTFLPRDLKDYSHHLIFKTDNESFELPIIAIGPRPLLDIPDEITVQPAPVKIATSKVVIVRNIGTVPAGFNFISRGCFKVEPAKGILGVQELLQLSIIFESSVTGNYSETLHLHLETGEKLTIMLHGSAENINVRLDKNKIIHEDTFVGLKRSKVFRIQNSSQSLIRFSWKRNKTIKEDLNIVDRMRDKYEAVKEVEVIKDTKQVYHKLCNHKTHELAWDRILYDELRLSQGEEFKFQHPAFKIEPESGELFPKTHTEIIAVFEPTTCGLTSAEAYLEVSGRDERLTLQMKGYGLGPLIVLSIEILDIDFIFLCSVHTYEVIAVNKGDIPGTIIFKQEPLVFGGKVEVMPNRRYLKPGEHVALIIAFTSNRHGDFTEKLNFVIVESGEIVSLVLKGKIVSPTLHFDKTQIDFGTISVGFPVSKEVTLSNLSMVPVTFSLRILSEGNQPSMSYEKFSKLTVKPPLPRSPKEFQIYPAEGVVEPYSSRTVILILTANIARKWSTYLMVDMWDSETESVSCPVRFNSQIPSVSVQPSTISIPFCFINFPYTRLVTLENTSRISAFYYIIPQDPYEANAVTYSANVSQGVIEPKGTAKVSLTIMTNALGRQTLPLHVLIFGNEAPSDMCQICCVGQGPVVTIKPNSLVWGEVPLLQESVKYLTITNESPIPASFTVTMGKPESPWVITPAHSILAPEEKISLNIMLMLRDRGKYQDVLKIQIVNGKTLSCSTSALGIGNSLLMQPNITGKYDLGTLFSHKKYSYEILVKNEGTKLIGVVWCPIEDYRAFVAMKFANPTELIFKMEPTKIDLPGGSSKIINLEVHSSHTGVFSQNFYCHANVEMPSKELYLASEVTAEFVEPLVAFDRTELNFYYNISSCGVEEKLTEFVNVINVSVLPLSVSVVVNQPFYLRGSSGDVIQRDEVDLCGKESKKIIVGFRAAEDASHCCQMYKDKLNISFKEHSKKASLLLTGEVNYPNVIILPRTVDFGCIPIAASAYREFIVVNVSPVTVNYTITWEEKSSYITYIDSSGPDLSGITDYGNSEMSYRSFSCDNEEGQEVTPEGGSDTIMQAKIQETNIETNETERGDESELVPPVKPILEIPEVRIKEDDIKNAIFPLIRKYYINDDELMSAYKSIRSSGSENDQTKPFFTKFFDITPFYGRLGKYETQVISISFQPNAAMEAQVQACLDIDSGPKETITINAKAADLDFLLNKIHINFGRQLFCETASEYLKIKNTSLLEFDFETNTVDPVGIDVDRDFFVEAGLLVITPRTGHIPPMSEKSLRVRYNPGLPGKFEEKFQLRIGYLDPITILVSGFAVFPQVHFDLPRYEINELPVEIGYAAVASITPDWLLTQIHHQKSYSTPTANRSEEEVDSGKKDDLEPEGDEETAETWTIITENDCVPSLIDIELAIERILAFKLLSQTNLQKGPLVFARSIPNFFVPTYEINFGVVTVGRRVEETFSVTNLGPLPIILYFAVEKDYKNRVMQIKMRARNEIKVGGTTQISITFDPKRSRFTGQYEKIEYVFYFEVYQGARIPVKASAIVTYPFVIPSTKSLNFNEVKCGYCKVMCMKLKNFGWVPASWSISFRLTSREITAMHQSGILDGRLMFYLTISKGVLYPNESCILQITFKPDFGGKFSATMIIKVEEGFDEHKIMLMGEAIEARLKISETSLTFEPTLPYPRKLSKFFTIQNSSAFPIEFYFPDFDEQIDEEERVIRAITLYYQTNELLLPARNPGDKLPSELTDFYRFLLDSLNMKYIEKKRDKRFQSSDSPSSMSVFADDVICDHPEKKRTKVKRGSSASRPRSNLVFQSHTSIPSINADTISIFKDKTQDEVEEMLHDYIKGYSPLEARFDPLKGLLDSLQLPRKSNTLESVQGLIIVLQGAPRTNIVQFTKLCARFVKKPVLNIDRMILEELALVRCDAAIIFRGIVEQIFSEHFHSKSFSSSAESPSVVFADKQAKDPGFEETVDELEKKLCQLFLLRDGASKPKPGVNDDKILSTGSAKKEKISTPNVKSTTQSGGILEGFDHLLVEIVKFRLQLEAVTGVIIENQSSKWINNTLSSLKFLMKAAGNITDILVICLTNSFEKYKEFKTQKEAEEEKRLTEVREEALRILEEESEDEFNSLPLNGDEKKELYFKFINNRNEEYKMFLKSAEERARYRKLKKGFQKKGLLGPSIAQSPKGQKGSPQREREKTFDGGARDREKSKEKNKAPRSAISTAAKSVKKEDEQEEKEFVVFEEQLTEMRNFLECWDRRLGTSFEKQTESQSGNKARKSSTPRKPSSMVDATEKAFKDVGVHLWLVDESNGKSSTAESVCQYLNQMLINRRISYDSESWTLDIPPSTTYSVVTSPAHRHPANLLDVFTLVPVDRNPSLSLTDDDISKINSQDKIEKSESQLSLKAKRKYSETARGRAESRLSTASKTTRMKKSLPSSIFEDQPFKSRWVLEEGESTYWGVQFYPSKIGKFDQYLPVNLVSGPTHNNYVIKCTGICDIPRLDMNPENIFSSIAPEKPRDLIYSPTFFYSNYYFDFGSVIPNQLKDEGHNRELHAIFSLTNISSLPVELTVMFADDALREIPVGSQHFDVEPNSAYLKPHQTFLLNVYANPSKYGSIQEVLMLFVKDNPKIETIKIKCYGVRVSVNIEPKLIDFDRLLLYRKDKRIITFTNSNLIPLFIVLSGYDKLPPQFSFSAVKSWVQPLMSFTIEVEYEANEVQVISEEIIQVLVYDRIEAVNPVQTLSFPVSAEAYDASVDIFFASKEENHVDFQEIRIQNECKKSVTLKNTGKYILGFKIDIDYDLLEENGNEEFFVSPEEGKLLVGKAFPLTVHFQARTEVNWKRLPLFRINLTEPYSNDELVASIPIEVSAKSFFSRYVMQPLSELNIGPVQVGARKAVTLSIENKGQFSFVYSIEPLSKDVISDMETDLNKKSSKRVSEASSKERTKKVPGTLKTGCFEITPSYGAVEVKQTAVITVNFSPTEAKHYEEAVVVKVSENPPHLKEGNELKIVAEGCIPQLNFDDFASVFREHQVKTSEADAPHLSDIGCQTLFITDTKQFWFKNVCLGKTVDARIHLENKGQIDCHVTCSVHKPDGKRSRSFTEAENDYFWVKPEEIIIPPYECGTFVIHFHPETLQSYKSQMTLSLHMLDKYNFATTTFSLNASVCTPEVDMVEPLLRSADGQGLVNFPPTTPGRTSSSVISFKNIGKIESKVILEIFHSEQDVFSVEPKPGTESTLKAWELGKPISHAVLVTLQPGKTAEFNVYFRPVEIKKYSCVIRLLIVDNGFENLRYKLFGEAFLEEIVLEKIQTAMPFSNERPLNASSYLQTNPGQYFLDLGYCFINKKKKFLARLANKTDKIYFRFEWEEAPTSITVQPSAGHLYPGTYKEILFEFLPQDTMEMEEFPLSCSLNKIQFAKLPPGPSWDSRLTYYQSAPTKEADSLQSKSYIRTSSRQETFQTNEIQICGQEPDYEIISDSDSEIVLFLSAVADYARLNCESTVINFADTFMFQNRSFSLPLENIGTVAFDYSLELKSVTYEHFKVDEASQADSASMMEPRRQSSSSKNSKSVSTRMKSAKRRNNNLPKPLGNESLLDLFPDREDELVSPRDVSPFIKVEPYNPIHLKNSSGTIRPKEKVFPRIIFSPLDVNEYKGIIKIKVDNVHPEQVLPEIEVTARSIMPYCHFDIPESDYIQSGRRDYSRPGPVGTGPGVPLDPQVKTIEIKILGVRVTKPIHFYAINPTDGDYSFSWSNVTQNQPGVVQSLHCTFLDGTIQAGRQKLMEFVFVSQNPGTFEYFWNFCVPQHNIETTFLFVIFVQEPVIYFLSNNLIMRPTSVGATVTDTITLINQDDASSDFFFLPDSLYSDGRLNSIQVQPLSGKINPKSEVILRVSFTGRTAGKILFQLKCKLKKLGNPLLVTVETMTYSVEPLVIFEDLSNVKHVANPAINNVVDFGKELQAERSEKITFFLTSTSRLSFYYEWVFDKKELVKQHCSLSFSQLEGHVTSYSRGECDLIIVFNKKSNLANFPVKLKIIRGPTYNFLVNASATSPAFEFSFSSYDFGYCYLQRTEFSFYETILTFKNKDKIDLLLESTSDSLQNFVCDINESGVGPGKDLSVPIKFYPKESVRYEEEISFTVASSFEKVIALSGQGIEFKVTLTNVSDANIQMGATRVGSKHSREFSVVNRGLAAATVLIGFSDQLPVSLLSLARPDENPPDLTSEHRLSNILTLSPSGFLTLRPKETQTLRVEYTPRHRTPSFTETVCMQFQERVDPLCVITGSSIGPEFSLDKKYLAFGAVVANYLSTLKLKIVNSGDIGARFEWETDTLDSEFSIFPASGYLSAGSDIVTEVTFHPKIIRHCIKKTVECKISISDTETFPSLSLKLSGDCVDLPQPLSSVAFECHVRDVDVTTIEINNRTGTDWTLMPIFSGEFFDGLELIFVPTMSSVEYEITYAPLTMTQPNNLHKGSLFFCLPDGTGQLYELLGTSLPPPPCEIIEREVPCKTKYTELLKVTNWLKSRQRFKVDRVCAANESSDDLVFMCSGSDTFELPPKAEKDYKLTFYAYKTGKLHFTVTFTNEETNEYVWYDIFFNIVMCGPLQAITLKSRVRQSCTHSIKLENPLAQPVQFKVECSNSEILLPLVDPVPPESTATVVITFRPLHVGGKIEQLKITCPELGAFPMELHLVAVEAAPQESVRFEAPLGCTDVQTITVPNYYHSQAILNCRTTSDEFRVHERVSVAGQDSASIDITYEPSSLGQSFANLHIESELAGNFSYPLVGNSLKPLPRGPYVLKPGTGINVPFKNVLREAKTFQIYVDNPEFSVKSSSEEIPSGSDLRINVSLQKFKDIEKLTVTGDAGLSSRYPVMGQLVIECFDPHIKWQYYLKGVVERTPTPKP